MSGFKPAARKAKKLKFSIQGPSGAGKTYTALKVATALVARTCPGKEIAFVDTEKSADMYAPPFVFAIDADFGEGPKLSYHPHRLIEKLENARKAGCFGAVIVDSLTHIWDGQGGFLSMHADLGEKQKAKGKQEDTWGNWKFIDPDYDALWTYIRNYPLHLILCLRSEEKTEKNAAGKIEKVGLQAIFRKKWEFEVDVQFAVVDGGSVMAVWKTRIDTLRDKSFKNPGDNVAEFLAEYLATGAPELDAPTPITAASSPPAPTPTVVKTQAPVNIEPSPETERHVPAAPAPMSVADSLVAEINAARTLDDLKALVSSIKTARSNKAITEEERNGPITKAYSEKQKALKGEVAA